MGSSNETTPAILKKTLRVKAKELEVKSLGLFGKMLKGEHRSSFCKTYGKILDLIGVDVQVEVVTALAQFYDPPMRCFTFQDFQMAPTLEEYEQILGYPLKNIKPYQYMGHYPSIQAIAKVLGVGEEELKSKMKDPGGVESIPLKYLEERLELLSTAKEWTLFIDTLALAIYGIVLFPRVDKYADLAAIDVLLAVRDRGENPVTAVLADTYYTFNYCYEKKGKKISCCFPALYVWLITHMFGNGKNTSCPIVEFKWCGVKAKSKQEWARSLADLSGKTICWCPQWKKIHEVIYRCGHFPNVPLMGTKGCINYNPALLLRQFGYPIRGPPTAEMVTPFVLYDMGPENSEALRKVRHAWKDVVRSRDLGKEGGITKPGYRQWLKERVQEVKLPFLGSVPIIEEIPVHMVIDNEEVEELKAKLLKAEEERDNLQEELRKVNRAREVMLWKDAQKTISLEKANKRARVEEGCKLKTQQYLRVSDESLEIAKKERNEAEATVEKLRGWLKDSKIAGRSTMRQLEDLKQQMKNMVAEYERKAEDERCGREEAMAVYEAAWRKEQDKVDALTHQVMEQREMIEAVKQEGRMWMDRFVLLAGISRQVIEEMPRLLREAEGMMHPFSTIPVEIVELIEEGQKLVAQMKGLTRCVV